MVVRVVDVVVRVVDVVVRVEGVVVRVVGVVVRVQGVVVRVEGVVVRVEGVVVRVEGVVVAAARAAAAHFPPPASPLLTSASGAHSRGARGVAPFTCTRRCPSVCLRPPACRCRPRWRGLGLVGARGALF